MIAFIDDHREVYGVEPICKVLPIAPSTYHAHVAKEAETRRNLSSLPGVTSLTSTPRNWGVLFCPP
jgi:hypothetical protein